jgi:hypothetical protein
MNAPQPPLQETALTPTLPARIGAQAVAVHLWVAARLRRLATARRDDGAGDPLTSAVITVGLVLIAAAVLLILRGKAQDIAESVCTNADPSTC